MSMYELSQPATDLMIKYNSLAAHYWRDKLHRLYNGLHPEDEMPSKD